MKKKIRAWKERVITGTLWEIVWEIGSYQNKMHVTSWTEYICLR
jgi:hypothetical protein